MSQTRALNALPPFHGFQEPTASSPLWLEYSGLPEWVNSKVGQSAWTVLKKVIEIDCASNASPAIIEITPAQIAEWCGLDSTTVVRALEGLRRKKCLALFLPEHPEERALIEVKTPLPTPRSPAEVRALFPFNRLDPGVRLRYAAAGEAAGSEKQSQTTGKKHLQRVIDLYFNTVGFKMNTFILDELRLICDRFDPRHVEKTFDRARKNDIRSLGWVVRELYRLSRRNERAKK